MPKTMTSAIEKGLSTARKSLEDVTSDYLSDYANDLLWENDIEFVSCRSDDSLIAGTIHQQILGNRAKIPDRVLNNLEHSAYLLVDGTHLFYFDQARNKITEITLRSGQLTNIREQWESITEEKIQIITKHAAPKNSIREIQDTDPVNIQFSKHAFLALHEAEELVTNLGNLFETYQAAAPSTPAQNVPTSESSDLAALLNMAADPSAVANLLEKTKTLTQIDESSPPESILSELGKLAVSSSSTVT